MLLTIALEHRFLKYGDGTIWSSSSFHHDFWCRYLEVFDRVKVLARAENVLEIPDNAVRSDGDYVEFHEIPCYIGPSGLMKNWHEVMSSIASSIEPESAYILRVPGTIGSILWLKIVKLRLSYGVEVLGDPYEIFSEGSINHSFRGVFKRVFPNVLKWQCSRASASCYVSEDLYAKYPCPNFSTVASDVFLSDNDYMHSARLTLAEAPFNIVFVGSLEQPYKAPDILIEAVEQCVKKGWDLNLRIIGDGKYKKILENGDATRFLGDRLEFLGRLSAGTAIIDELDRADLFILPSRTEGLPRAMVEAMARGLPCIGSKVGGIPELISEEDLVPPDDVGALAKKIIEVLGSPLRMKGMSIRNLEKAREFSDEVLSKKRREFFEYIKYSA